MLNVKGTKMNQNSFKKHIELNNNSSSYTANATCYFGKASWNKKETDAFLSISDCYNTIRLHPNCKYFDNAELKRFKKKLKRLEKFIAKYRQNLPDTLEDK